MAEWEEIKDDDLDHWRAEQDAGRAKVMWSQGKWWGTVLHAPVKRSEGGISIDELRENEGKTIVRTSEGTYVVQHKECECGEQYVELDSHKRDSARHKQWAKGDIEVPVPHQPLMGAFDRGDPTPPLELGKVVICGSCKAKEPKQNECPRCNGHGVVPNVGPLAAPRTKR